MLTKPPIWEPEGTRYRPYNLSTLIFFYIGRFFWVEETGIFDGLQPPALLGSGKQAMTKCQHEQGVCTLRE
jgi:hypothetical protein